MPLANALAGPNDLPGGVMDPILANRLGLAIGDTFRLGVQDFVLTAHITREPDGFGSGFSFGPRTLVRSADLANAELLGPGTLYEVNYRLRLPDAELDAARETAMAGLEGAGVRWRDSRNAAPQVRQVIDRVSSFLVLVGLAGLAVGGVGVSAAVRTYLDGKTNVIATLKTLGAQSRTIFAIYLMQIGVLTGLGLAVGLTLGALVPFIVAPLRGRSIAGVPADIPVTRRTGRSRDLRRADRADLHALAACPHGTRARRHHLSRRGRGHARLAPPAIPADHCRAGRARWCWCPPGSRLCRCWHMPPRAAFWARWSCWPLPPWRCACWRGAGPRARIAGPNRTAHGHGGYLEPARRGGGRDPVARAGPDRAGGRGPDRPQPAQCHRHRPAGTRAQLLFLDIQKSQLGGFLDRLRAGPGCRAKCKPPPCCAAS